MIAALLLLAGTQGAVAQTGPGAPYGRPGTMPQDAGLADPTAGAAGPHGTSQRSGDARYDKTLFAGIAPEVTGVTALHATLPAQTVVEVTSLANGRTILVLVTGAAEPGAEEVVLSAGAARELGHADASEPLPVRVRKVTATAPDEVALRSGRPASGRPDAPAVLLNVLRKQLPAGPAAAAPISTRNVVAVRPPRPSAPAPARAASGRYFVQIAALSNGRNALALAKAMGGFVKQGGGLHRVQLGPFATRQEAERARSGAARAGHGDARVVN